MKVIPLRLNVPAERNKWRLKLLASNVSRFAPGPLIVSPLSIRISLPPIEIVRGVLKKTESKQIAPPAGASFIAFRKLPVVLMLSETFETKDRFDSNAPMSTVPSRLRGKPAPRASVVNGLPLASSANALLPALSAGLSHRRDIVCT